MPFIGLTEDWRLRGRMDISGRLSDALNKREAIPITEVSWGPPDNSTPLEEAPGLRSVDPYDLILVTAGEDSLPPLTDTERTALKVHKVAYDVALEVPPFRVIGTVYLHPGSEPDRLLDRSSEMFVAIVDAVARLGDLEVTRPGGRRDPRQPVLPAWRRAGRQAHGRAAPEAARGPAGRRQLAGPLALTPAGRPGGDAATIRAVVFDVGETLVDENREWLAWADWLGIQRLTFLAVLGAVIERGGDHLEPVRILRPDVDLRTALREREAAGVPAGILPEDLYPDALDALRSLRAAGYRVGVAGNQPQRSEAVFEDVGFALDLVASSESLGAQKPDPAFFAAIADRLGLPANAVAYVGDRVDNDVRPAAAAGMAAIFLRRGPWAWIQAGRAPVPEAAATIDDLTTIVEVVRRLG